LYDPEPETTLMAQQAKNCLGLAILCPIPHQVAEDQVADADHQGAENEDQVADAKCNYIQ